MSVSQPSNFWLRQHDEAPAAASHVPPSWPAAWLDELTELTARWATDRYQAGSVVYELGCGAGTTLDRLAAAFGRRQIAARFVGVEESRRLLSRAEETLRPWLAEHEITLLAAAPGEVQLAHASVVLGHQSLTALPQPQRSETLTSIRGGMLSRGVLLLNGLVRAEGAASQPGGAPTYSELLRDLERAGFSSPEPLLKWHEAVVLVAFTA